MKHGRLKYDCKNGFPLGRRLGRYGKPLNLSNSLRNVISLPLHRGFSMEEPHKFKKLVMARNKYVNLIDVLADVNFLQGAYQKIKSNQGMMTKGSSQETLDKLDNNWFNKTSKKLLDGSFSVSFS